MKSLLLSIGILLVSIGCNSSSPQPNTKFSEADVARAEVDISSHYEDHGFTVEQVNLIKESDRRLSGYVKIRKASGIIRPQFTKNCVASMDVDSGKSI